MPGAESVKNCFGKSGFAVGGTAQGAVCGEWGLRRNLLILLHKCVQLGVFFHHDTAEEHLRLGHQMCKCEIFFKKVFTSESYSILVNCWICQNAKRYIAFYQLCLLENCTVIPSSIYSVFEQVVCSSRKQMVMESNPASCRSDLRSWCVHSGPSVSLSSSSTLLEILEAIKHPT